MADIQENQKQWAKIIARAWEDEEYKKRLLAEPAAVLAEEGAKIPAGYACRIQEVNEKEIVLVLPAKPSDVQVEHLTADERLSASWGPAVW